MILLARLDLALWDDTGCSSLAHLENYTQTSHFIEACLEENSYTCYC